MTRDQVRQRIVEVGIVPVIRAASVERALLAADAVAAGGIPIVEITMTVPGAVDAIRALSKRTDLLVGAGTVLTPEAAQQCLDAGAQFLVSPGWKLSTIEFAHGANVLIMPGALTPTEVITAWESGADFVKIFPCGNVGGPAYIKSLKAALPQIPMIPTGGVNLSTAAAFLDAGAAALGIGGELVSATATAEEITATARNYVAIVNARKKQ